MPPPKDAAYRANSLSEFCRRSRQRSSDPREMLQ